jgi:hypothetical protein
MPRCEYRAAASFAQRIPIVFVTGWGNDVALYLTRPRQGPDPIFCLLGCMRWNDLGHRLTETGNQNGFTGFADVLQHRQAGGLELGDRYLFRNNFYVLLWSKTMVNSRIAMPLFPVIVINANLR